MNLSTDSNTAPLSLHGDPANRKGFDKRGDTSSQKKISGNRKMWWKKTVVRRSTSSIEPEFDHVTARSQFLQRHAGDDKSNRGIALFHRSEIMTGRVLGQGGFSLVSEVTRFQLSREVSERCTQEEQYIREQYAAVTLNDTSINTVNEPHARYCIKHLQERLILSPKDFQCAASDLAVEAAFLSTLEHDNIVSVRGLPIDGIQAWGDGQHDGYFIIMDRLSNTLDKQIQEWQDDSVTSTRVPTVMERTEMATQLASALQYLHENRIIFRDLKPANIGFTTDRRVKLFDFGLCRELPHREPSTPCGMYEMSGVGTRRYMAPEIINEARYNLKADVYGWAMVFWEMLSLTKPYAPYSTTDHRREVCGRGERPEYLHHVPSDVQHLMKQAWDQNVERRLTMNEVVLHLHMVMRVDKENRNQELNMTNHANINVKTNFTMPISPTGVHDFFGNGAATAMSTSKSLDGASMQHCPELFGEADRQNLLPVMAGTRRNSKKKPTDFLNLPDTVVRTVSAVSTNKSLNSGSIEHYFHDDQLFCEDSPPPLNKKPTAFLSIPDTVVNAIALSWSDDDVSDIDSLALDESIVEHMLNDVAL